MTNDKRSRRDPWYVRYALIGLTVGIVGFLILLPLADLFAQAFALGVVAYWEGLANNADTRHSILLTLAIAPVSVAFNTVFGVAAAWTIARFRFPGRAILMTLIDLPFSVSPVVVGLMFVLLLGPNTRVGGWLLGHDYKVIFAPPGILLVTLFVTFPFVARELIPIFEAVGSEEEIAARSLGANGWQMFWRVTVPNIKWGLIYGIILCNARAMGEFGAVAIVSGKIAGQTETMPLRVQKLHEGLSESDKAAAFALASVLTLLSLVTLVIKVGIERNFRAEHRVRE